MKNYFILFAIILVGCSETKSSETAFTEIHINPEHKIDFNEKISDIQFIPLEINQKGRFTDCTKIRFYKNRIYLYSLSNFSVFIYSDQGNFINALHGTSSPKLEDPSTIFINKAEDQLWVINERRQVMKYDLDGQFIEKEPLSFQAVDITALDDKVLLYFHGGFNKDIEYHFTKQEIKNKENTQQILPYKSENDKRTYIPLSLFAETAKNDKVYMLISDKVYLSDKTTNYQVNPLFHLNFKDAFLLNEVFDVRQLSFKEIADKRQSKEYINSIDNFYLASDYLFMRLEGKYNTFCAVNINNQQTFTFDCIFDKLLSVGSRYSILGGEDNKLYGIFPNKTLINYYKDHPTLYKGIEEKISLLPDDPNGWTIATIYVK